MKAINRQFTTGALSILKLRCNLKATQVQATYRSHIELQSYSALDFTEKPLAKLEKNTWMTEEKIA